MIYTYLCFLFTEVIKIQWYQTRCPTWRKFIVKDSRYRKCIIL